MSKTRDSDPKSGRTEPRAAGEAPPPQRGANFHRTAAGGRRLLDTSELTRSNGQLDGVETLEDFERLDDLLYDLDGSIEWQLAGRREPRPDGSRQPWLTLHVRAHLGLECTRCLQRVPVELDESRQFLLVSDEALAARADSVDEDFDVLVGSQDFDVLDLVEDEVIMMLPLVPRHPQCDLPAGGFEAGDQQAGAGGAVPAGERLQQGADEAGMQGEEPPGDERPNPFAALASLRKPGPK